MRATLLASREAQRDDPALAARNEALEARIETLLAQHAAAVTCIGFYWPVAGEFDARALLTRWLAADAGRRAALPVVVQPKAPLLFHAWHAHMPMKEGRYRIPVPAETSAVVPDLLLVPCVGFDTARLRLGYGGGYYDRTLAAWPGGKRPATIGIAYELGKCNALPREVHDLPLDAVVTEAAVY